MRLRKREVHSLCFDFAFSITKSGRQSGELEPQLRECTMKEGNIQRRECQAIRGIFDRVGSLKQVLIVGLDYASEEHRGVFCNGQGDLLCKPVWVHNDQAGLAFVESRVATLCSTHGIEPFNVVFGGESPSSWALNFADSLQGNGHVVIDLHAQDVKRQRENMTTDNDSLAALTISRCLIAKMGQLHVRPGLYTELRQAVRFHAKLAKELTRNRNRIQSCADICFPGLLGDEKCGIADFSPSCLWLLEHHTASSVSSQPLSRLIGQLRRQGVRAVEKTAAKLRELADRALPAAPATQRTHHHHLCWLIAQNRLLGEQERQAVNRAAGLLRQTPGALLTSVKGIGLKFAFQLVAEIGAPELIDSVDRKVNYFGLTDKSHQSGGRSKSAKKKGRQSRCNHFAKKAILGISDSVARWGPVEYREYYRQRKLQGRNARQALGRKLLRFAISVMRNPHVYVPPELRNEPMDSPLRRIHLRSVVERMRRVWAPCTQRPEPQDDALKQWEEMVNTIHRTHFDI